MSLILYERLLMIYRIESLMEGMRMESVYVGNNHRVNLDSYTMRKDLSEAIRWYSRRLQGLGKLTEEDRRNIEAPGKLATLHKTVH